MHYIDYIRLDEIRSKIHYVINILLSKICLLFFVVLICLIKEIYYRFVTCTLANVYSDLNTQADPCIPLVRLPSKNALLKPTLHRALSSTQKVIISLLFFSLLNGKKIKDKQLFNFSLKFITYFS